MTAVHEQIDEAARLDFRSSDDVASALHGVSDADLLRLRAIARLHARGTPDGLTWSDLLNEAVVRAMGGSRRWPTDLSLVAFLSGVMRSLRDEHWKWQRREALWSVDACPDYRDDADPERAFASIQSLAELNRLFAKDGAAIRILTGLAEGPSADEIRRTYDLGSVEYDTARRRIRRLLLRQDLACTGR